MNQTPEVWLRGPIAGVPPLLMPAVHGLLQVREELERTVRTLNREQLWLTPGGAGSIGFHLKHLAGSLDRLLTYAEGNTLNTRQLQVLRTEGVAEGSPSELLSQALDAIDEAVQRIRSTNPADIGQARRVGRAGLPSTVWGLIFHAAEHTQRHAGQIATMAKVVSGERGR
jgi:uncharacterized damage-inducible protein DinB